MEEMETIIQLKKYFKKLLLLIGEDTVFNLMGVRFVKKNRIDDIICCIEATFPEKYKAYIKSKKKKLKTDENYTALLKVIKNKFLLSSFYYKIYYAEANKCISNILSTIEADILFAESNDSSNI